MKFEKIIFKNENFLMKESQKIDRKEFKVVKVTFEKNDEKTLKELRIKAEGLALNCNSGAANTSLPRTYDEKLIHALAGVIAEEICLNNINYNNKGRASYTNYTGGINQIDIKLSNNKTVEVRSSCIKNGVDFALFSKNKYNENQQNFDVLGPYQNGYKSDEKEKDFYIRVLYHCQSKEFLTYSAKKDFVAYIVGGATWEMMCDEKIIQIKSLAPEGTNPDTVSEYRVIPIGKALDANQILKEISK